MEELRDLRVRLEKLERQNRRMRRGCLLMVLLGVAASATGKVPSTRVIDTNEIILRDSGGKMRARLWFGTQLGKSPDSVFFNLYSTDEKELVTVAASSKAHDGTITLGGIVGEAAKVWLHSDSQNASISLNSPVNALEGIRLSSKQGESMLSISGTGNIFKGISLTDTAKGGNFYLNDSSGSAGVFIMASDGKDVLSVENTTGTKSYLFGDELNLAESVNLFAGKQGPFLKLKDTEGFQSQLGVSGTVSTVTGHQQTTSAASLVMFGKDGKVIWSAPR